MQRRFPRLGDYLLRGRLAIGGMGEVFLASRPNDDELVVVKRLLPHLASDKEVVALFLREATLSQGLIHPNLPRVLATGQDDGQPYLVMELLRGVSLDHMVEGGLPPAVAGAIIGQVATALAHLHDRPGGAIIHRDLKPSNVMVAIDGVVRVVDLGLARAEDGSSRTEARGTAPYMSPEQLERRALGPASDVFALALVAAECLRGRRAFTAERKVDDAPDLSGLEPAVVAALTRGLDHTPDQRPTATALAAGYLGALAVAPLDAAGLAAWLRDHQIAALSAQATVISRALATDGEATKTMLGPGSVGLGSDTAATRPSRAARSPAAIRADEDEAVLLPSELAHPRALRRRWPLVALYAAAIGVGLWLGLSGHSPW